MWDTLELNNKKGKSKDKILIIFLIIFTILAISITIVAIDITNHQKIQENNLLEEEKIQEKPNGDVAEDEANLVVALTDTYDTNAIEIKDYWYLDGIIKSDEEVKQDTSFNENNYKKCATFIQIQGLKNKEVEKNINQEIKSKVIENMEINKNVYVIVWGNFANVLSMTIESNIGEEYDTMALNYRLDTGEKIKFEDLFTNKAYIKNVLTQSIYEAMSWKYIGSSADSPLIDADEVDYMKIENATFEIMQSYLEKPDIKFYFSPDEIQTYINDKLISINMADFYEYIAIYKRYANQENLYEDDSKGQKGLYVFSSRTTTEYNLYYSKLEQITDNLFVDIWLYDQDETGQKEKEINNMQEVLGKVEKEAKENPDKAYIFTYFTYGDESNKTIMKYMMNKKYYDKNGKELIAKANRKASQYNGVMDIEVYYKEADNKDITEYIYYQDKFLTEKEYEKALEEDID